ncbi:Uncharacterised protein [uncultured Clostridium sp.]|nr:Uncharacterised protein [uncultured Clostridium sp.]
MEHVQKLTLDMGLRVTPPKLHAKQGDKGTRKITCELVMDGVPYAPGEGVTALYALRKPDDTQVIENAQLSGSACSLTLSDQCLTVPGVCLCELILYKDEAVLASATFEVDVSPNVYDEDGVISSDDYGALVAATAAANTAAQEANSAAALANEKAELAGQRAAQAQEQAQAAQTQASAAQAAAAAANTAKTAADTAAQAANTAAQNAQTQADYAQKQGDAVADIIEQGGFASVGQLVNPSLLINGDFSIWQHGTEITVTGTTPVYGPDRWGITASTGTVTAKKLTGVMQIAGNGRIAQVTNMGRSGLFFTEPGNYTFSVRARRVSAAPTITLKIIEANSITADSTILAQETFVFDSSTDWQTYSITAPNVKTNTPGVVAAIEFNGEIRLFWCKLELGNVTTGFMPRPTDIERMLADGYNPVNPNLLINGGFDVWQRGAGPFAPEVGKVIYGPDRWMIDNTYTSYTLQASKDGDGVLKATGIGRVFQFLEIPPSFGYNQSYTFSIDVRHDGDQSRPQIAIMSMSSIGQGHIFRAISPTSSSNEWARYSVTIDQWTKGAYMGVALWCNGGNNYFRNAKLEVGSVATPFVPADYATELMRCMRYYWRPETYLYTHFVPADRDQWYLLVGLVFPVRMRVAPTTTIYEPHNIFLNEPDYGGYKFGAEDWGAPDHIWPRGDSDRTNYERLKEWGVKVDGLTELLIEDFGNPDTPPDNDRWAYYFHAEFDAEIY